MIRQRADINLGDFVKALTALKPNTSREQDIVLECLGLKIDPTKNNESSYTPRSAWRRDQQNNDELQTPQVNNQPITSPTPEKAPETTGAPLPINISSRGQTLPPSISVPHIDEPLFQKNSSAFIVPKRNNLFTDRKSRALLTIATAQFTPGTTLDIPRLIKSIVDRKPEKKLPTIPRLTNQNGCQLLLDFSDALMPWWEDMRTLITQCHSLLGEANCPVYEFDYNPQDSVRWTESGEIPWKLTNNKPVLLATDFGITNYSKQSLRPSFGTWRDFAQHCYKHRTPVIALTPIERKRAPEMFDKLEKLITIIEWHPLTTVTDIKRLLMNQRSGIK